MAIPHTVQEMQSGIVGTLAKLGPSRVRAALLSYDETQDRKAYPGRAATFNGEQTVDVGGEGVFAGIILGNQRVLSDTQAEHYLTGDAIEVIAMGEVFVTLELGTDVKRGDAVFFENATGKIGAGVADEGQTQIENAVVTDVGNNGVVPALARIMLTGPVA